MVCDDCVHKRNCINGKFCMFKNIYVQWRDITDCSDYDNGDI